MSLSPSPHLRLKMSVWSMETLLVLLLVSQPQGWAASSSSPSASSDERRFVSFGRVPVSWPLPLLHSTCDGDGRGIINNRGNRCSSTSARIKTDKSTRRQANKATPPTGTLMATSIPRAFRHQIGRERSSTALNQPISSLESAAVSSSSKTVAERLENADTNEDQTTTNQSSPSSDTAPTQPSLLQPRIWMKRFTDSTLAHVPIDFSDCFPPFLRPLHGKNRRTTQSSSTTGAAEDASTTLSNESQLLATLTQPLIPEESWHQMTGSEFRDHPELVSALAVMGEAVARQDASSEWIEWQEYGRSGSATSRGGGGGDDEKNKSLHNGEIQVWTGRCVSSSPHTAQPYFGAQLPFVKTRSIIPFAVDEMVDLLLDSSRVQLYNPWSLGRRDCWVAVAADDGDNNNPVPTVTKIVKNRVQPPLGSKAMVSTTLLHARPALSNDGSWVVVSRSVGHNGSALFAAPSDDDATAGRSDILLGVNLLQPVSENSCILTAATHVYSSAVPTLLAERLGVQSAIKFVKDMRKLKATPAVTTTAKASTVEGCRA